MRLGRFRPEVLAAFTQTPSVKREVRKVAAAVRKEARRRAPKDEGTLRAGIAVDNVLDSSTGQVEYRVGWTKQAFYGGLVELGTEDTPPQPHLRTAADAVRAGLATSTDDQ